MKRLVVLVSFFLVCGCASDELDDGDFVIDDEDRADIGATTEQLAEGEQFTGSIPCSQSQGCDLALTVGVQAPADSMLHFTEAFQAGGGRVNIATLTLEDSDGRLLGQPTVVLESITRKGDVLSSIIRLNERYRVPEGWTRVTLTRSVVQAQNPPEEIEFILMTDTGVADGNLSGSQARLAEGDEYRALGWCPNHNGCTVEVVIKVYSPVSATAHYDRALDESNNEVEIAEITILNTDDVRVGGPTAIVMEEYAVQDDDVYSSIELPERYRVDSGWVKVELVRSQVNAFSSIDELAFIVYLIVH